MGLTSPNQDAIWLDSNINYAYENTRAVLVNFKKKLGQEFTYGLVDVVQPDCMECKLIVTDNFIQRDHIPLWPEFYGNYLYRPSYNLKTPSHLFNCFMSRSDPFRQSWLYQFQRRNLIDQGLITFNLDYRSPDLEHLKGTVELFDALFARGNEIFELEHKILRNRVPFCNFNTSLEQAITDSKVSIVLETYFDREEVIAFSEKVFRSLQLPRPLLLFSAPGAIQHIKNCGFDVLDDLVDHRYDLESNAVVRQVKILDQLEVINTLQYNSTVVNRMQQASEHNQARLSQLLTQWPERFQNIRAQLHDYKYQRLAHVTGM
jgi:hypothetical protein